AFLARNVGTRPHAVLQLGGVNLGAFVVVRPVQERQAEAHLMVLLGLTGDALRDSLLGGDAEREDGRLVEPALLLLNVARSADKPRRHAEPAADLLNAETARLEELGLRRSQRELLEVHLPVKNQDALAFAPELAESPHG